MGDCVVPVVSDTLRIEYVPLSQVRRWTRNPKKHDIGAIVQSIARYGFVDPPKFDPALNGGEGGLVYGNGRDEALAWMKAQGHQVPRGIREEGDEWYLPIKYGVDAPSLAEAEALAIDHNNLTMSGGDFTGFDMARAWEADYTDVLASLAAQSALPITVDADDLTALLAGVVEEGGGGDDFDTTPALDGPTRTALGDLWVIGDKHCLLVGDCTDPANVERLMGGERAALVVTSPPYNSKSELHGNDKFRGSFYLDKNVDAMTPEEYRAFSRNVFFSIGLCVAEDGNVCYNLSYNKNNRDGYIFVIADAIEAGFNLYETIAWVKTGMPNPASTDVMTRDYEFVFLLSRAGTYQTTKAKGEVRSNVWEINNAGAQQDNHKACFPVELPARAMRDLTRDGDTVVDLFLGSGTTLIAAHRTGRRCYGMEISPRYADVILKRAEAEGLTCTRVEP